MIDLLRLLQATPGSKEEAVLGALRNVIDPDFGEDIVACGFIKALSVDQLTGKVAVTIELTTPACPVKDMFQRQATQFIKVRRETSCLMGPLGMTRVLISNIRKHGAAQLVCF
jgi:metal-sulfur cluster biosynthetic enzyme